ncbi:hypothetical protein [Actibacterium sp. 188UL27-1]|nr:hypothetical protein [Actibacterium sp. 188UL27-1]
MRPMLLAFLAIAIITVGAWYGLNQAGFSAADRQSGDAVRLP